jgi:hypothetical protein
MIQLPARDQAFALVRLRGLLDRRIAVDAGQLADEPEDLLWLVRALDAAIVSYYRLAQALGVEADADVLLPTYRGLGLGTA